MFSMNKYALTLILLLAALPALASDSAASPSSSVEEQRNNWGGKIIKSPFGLGLDIQTIYMWRRMEMLTEDSAPVLFPAINYSYKGLYLYAISDYAINSKYAEVDFGISYTWS